MDNSKYKGIKEASIIRVKDGGQKSVVDKIIIEEPLEIRIKHRGRLSQVAVTMRTPGDDDDLALGFLFTEGIIQSTEDIIICATVDENVVEVELSDKLTLPEGLLQRNTFMSSSCGICGKASLDLIKTNTQYLPWSSKVKVNLSIVTSLRSRLDDMDNMFSITGGNHAVVLFDHNGNLLKTTEDVGRHNAMDKLIGSQLKVDSLPLASHICLLSGRASFELIQKAMMAGFGMVVSVGAPSSLAIDLAEEVGITLLGFLKNDGCNIYTGVERVIF